jgi:hypothetical protein
VDVDAVVVLVEVLEVVVVLVAVELLMVVVLVVPTATGVPDRAETGITPQIESPGKLRGAACVQGPDGGW